MSGELYQIGERRFWREFLALRGMWQRKHIVKKGAEIEVNELLYRNWVLESYRLMWDIGLQNTNLNVSLLLF